MLLVVAEQPNGNVVNTMCEKDVVTAERQARIVVVATTNRRRLLIFLTCSCLSAIVRLQRDYDDWMDRVPRGGDYLNYALIHGTKLRTEANNYVRRLHRSGNGFEALRLLRLRYTGGQMLQNYQLLRELLNPKFTESQQHYQYRKWLETLSRYELEARQPLDDNLKIATLLNGLRGNLQQYLLLSVKPTSTWQNVREIVENYYSSTFVPNPTTAHIAYLARVSPEERVN